LHHLLGCIIIGLCTTSFGTKDPHDVSVPINKFTRYAHTTTELIGQSGPWKNANHVENGKITFFTRLGISRRLLYLALYEDYFESARLGFLAPEKTERITTSLPKAYKTIETHAKDVVRTAGELLTAVHENPDISPTQYSAILKELTSNRPLPLKPPQGFNNMTDPRIRSDLDSSASDTERVLYNLVAERTISSLIDLNFMYDIVRKVWERQQVSDFMNHSLENPEVNSISDLFQLFDKNEEHFLPPGISSTADVDKILSVPQESISAAAFWGLAHHIRDYAAPGRVTIAELLSRSWDLNPEKFGNHIAQHARYFEEKKASQHAKTEDFNAIDIKASFAGKEKHGAVEFTIDQPANYIFLGEWKGKNVALVDGGDKLRDFKLQLKMGYNVKSFALCIGTTLYSISGSSFHEMRKIVDAKQPIEANYGKVAIAIDDAGDRKRINDGAIFPKGFSNWFKNSLKRTIDANHFVLRQWVPADS